MSFYFILLVIFVVFSGNLVFLDLRGYVFNVFFFRLGITGIEFLVGLFELDVIFIKV